MTSLSKRMAQMIDKKSSDVNGWLSPTGKMYYCIEGDHITKAHQIGPGAQALERLGWIKIGNGHTYEPDRDATQSQINKLFDLLGRLPRWAQ